MLTHSPWSSLAELLLSVLQAASWREGTALLCGGWEEAPVLDWLSRHPLSWQLEAVLDLTQVAEEQGGIFHFLSKHFRSLGLKTLPPSSSVLLFGADPQCISAVLHSAQELGLTLPAVHWLLGQPLTPEVLHTLGLPFGLLAYGEVNQKPLDFYIQDAMELVTRAVSAAAAVWPDRALIQSMVNCYDKRSQERAPSSGQYLARYMSPQPDVLC
ncbi:UNVERIFIED_CONTAM: hypothetical protein FKN15_050135 [Acipenser sinensis]